MEDGLPRIWRDIEKELSDRQEDYFTYGSEHKINRFPLRVELSGGEWQKISIARGLNKDADIIILDEPTSALDPLVEYDILKKFVDLTEGKTSVIISHRVGLCRFADGKNNPCRGCFPAWVSMSSDSMDHCLLISSSNLLASTSV